MDEQKNDIREWKAKPMRVFIHIGYTKTGTTSIQRALYENRETIKQYNCYYPETGIVNNHHFYFAHNIIGPASPFFDRSKGRVEDMLDEMKSFPDDATVILSCETMIRYADQDIIKIREIFKEFDVTIVAYVRRQDSWLSSQFIQVKKNIPLVVKDQAKRAGFRITPENLDHIISETFEDFCESSTSRPSGDYFSVLENWAKYFGTERILVRVFERDKLVGGDAVTDFVSLVGIPTESLSLDAHANTSPDWKSCIAALQLMNHARDVDIGVNNWAVWFAASALNASEEVQAWNDDSDGFLTLENSRKIMQNYEESNRQLGEKYLKQVPPFSDKEVRNVVQRDVNQIPRKEYIDALSSSLIRVSKDLVKSTNRVKRLESEIALLQEDRTLSMESARATSGGPVK